MAAIVFQPLEITPRRRAWRRLMRRSGAMLGLGVVLFFVVVALLAPWLAPYDPVATSWSAVRHTPGSEYLFGADELGRDVLSRVIWGTRAPLLAINFADDLINPPELGILEREIKRVPKGRAVVLPLSDKTGGHGSHTIAKLWKDELVRLLNETARK